MGTWRLTPVRAPLVRTATDVVAEGSTTDLAGYATYTTQIFMLGGLFVPRQFKTSGASVNRYPTAGWWIDAYAYADQPGTLQPWGKPTDIGICSFRKVGPAFMVTANVAFYLQGWRAPMAFVYFVYTNGASATTTFEFSVNVRGN
jgi:hypothetical protein